MVTMQGHGAASPRSDEPLETPAPSRISAFPGKDAPTLAIEATRDKASRAPRRRKKLNDELRRDWARANLIKVVVMVTLGLGVVFGTAFLASLLSNTEIPSFAPKR